MAVVEWKFWAVGLVNLRILLNLEHRVVGVLGTSMLVISLILKLRYGMRSGSSYLRYSLKTGGLGFCYRSYLVVDIIVNFWLIFNQVCLTHLIYKFQLDCYFCSNSKIDSYSDYNDFDYDYFLGSDYVIFDTDPNSQSDSFYSLG